MGVASCRRNRSLHDPQKPVRALDSEHGQADVDVTEHLVERLAIKPLVHKQGLSERLH
jgi:hypothetical protein